MFLRRPAGSLFGLVLAATSFAITVPAVTSPAAAAPVVDTTTVKPSPTTVAVGSDHVIFLAANGAVYGIGAQNMGAVTGTGIANQPRQLTGLPAGVTGVKVAAVASQTVVLASDGKVYATGTNPDGQLTDLPASAPPTPTLTPLSGLPDGVRAVDVAIGNVNTIVRGDNGVLYGTGKADSGQLPGVAQEDGVTTLTPLSALPGGDSASHVFAGNQALGVIAGDGSVYLAGANNFGQLTGSNNVSTWTEPTGLPAGYQAESIAMGTTHVSILLGTGDVYTSGNNSGSGVFGDGGTAVVPRTMVPETSPQTFVGLASSSGPLSASANVAVSNNGSAYGVGANPDSQLTDLANPTKTYSVLSEATAIGTIVEAAVGSGTTVVRDSLGVLYGTGRNSSYQLGGVVNGPGVKRTTLTLIPGQPIIATEVPAVTGTPTVGQTLTAPSVTWAPAVGAPTYQWLRNGEPIDGAVGVNYTLQGADAGQSIAVRVTQSQADFFAGVATTAAVPIAAAAFSSTPAPTITGTASVGSSLTATVPASAPAAEESTLIWRRNGVPIPGATGSVYRLVTADAGRTISVEVTRSRVGYTAQSTLSAGRNIPAVVTKKPTISGTAVVGRVLTAAKGTWAAPGYTFSYQWLRNGKPIPRATSTRYKVVAADRKTRLSIRVTATRKGFGTVVSLSPPITVR